MRTLFPAFFALCSALIFACSPTPPAPPPMLIAIQNGHLQFADGSSRSIPHYDDSTYIVFYCVRHCEKVKDGSKDPDLTPEGQAHAERLGRILAGGQIDRICTTTYKRTIQTGEAVQSRAGNPSFETYPAESQGVWLDSVLEAGGGKRYLVVGHQNTVPQLLNHLMGKTQFQNIPEDEFGMLYVVATKGPGATEVIEIRY